ncbi:hypothetical protein Ndes2526B_g03672 [Nannochloris sp. 'desiccata']|nr:hypothetical protein KSW81_005461 [Chlorella desiccata (nom. nud.)]KAH7621332.1 putative Alpha-soluble NSF attachment protein [Chlorella desiccata (nom. nud.)]
MSEFMSRAKGYVAQGDRKLLSLGWFSNKYEEAAEFFEKGANQFKLAKAWKEAGDTYIKLAEVNIKLESKHDSATAWVEAAKAYQKCDQKKSVNCLQKAVSLYTDMGRLGMAARQLREVAEILEKEDDSRPESLLFYEQAADLFGADNSTAEASKCLLKVAQFSAEAENYPKAIGIYEQVARAAADNNLLRFSAKGHLLHAALCSLCYAGPAATRDRLERYKDIDVNLDGSRESVLVESLVNATEEGDPEAFTAAVAEFDALTRLDAFKTALLLRAKRKLTEAPQDEEEDLT